MQLKGKHARMQNTSLVKQLFKIVATAYTMHHPFGWPLHLRYVRCTACSKGVNESFLLVICFCCCFPIFSIIFSFIGLSSLMGHLCFWRQALSVGVCSLGCNNIVTSPLHESRLLWIHDPHRNQSSRVPASHPPASQKTNPVPRTNNTVPRTNNTVPRINNTVPRNNNNPVSRNHENGPRNGPIPGPAPQSSDVRMRAPLDNVSSSVRCNSSLSSRVNSCPPVPRNNATDRQTDRHTENRVSPSQEKEDKL